jgi:hypothetical protein
MCPEIIFIIINSFESIVVINFGSDCKEDWVKAEVGAIAAYKEINGDVDVRGARFVKVCFK